MPTRPRLTAGEVRKIRRMVRDRVMSQRQLAEDYGVHESTISRAVHGKWQCYDLKE